MQKLPACMRHYSSFSNTCSDCSKQPLVWHDSKTNIMIKCDECITRRRLRQPPQYDCEQCVKCNNDFCKKHQILYCKECKIMSYIKWTIGDPLVPCTDETKFVISMNDWISTNQKYCNVYVILYDAFAKK